jgi:hypothetical protein
MKSITDKYREKYSYKGNRTLGGAIDIRELCNAVDRLCLLVPKD